MTDPEFEHDYDLESVIKVRTKGPDFEFLVTPRYLNHYVKNVYEDASVRLIRQNAKGVATFIDVGGHYGYFDVVVGLSNPACKIIAFEPVPENAEILRRNLDLHGLEGEVHEAAVSDNTGQAQLQVSVAGDNSGFIANPAVDVLRTIPVEVVQLDDYISKLPAGPILVKMDTEGHEMHVLEGMRNLIASREDVRLLVEFNPKCLEAGGERGDALLAKLRDLGFDLFFVHEEEGWFEPFIADRGWAESMGEANYLNVFCVKRERSANLLFFSHSAQWAGGERSLFELVEGMTRKFGALCTVALPYEGPLAAALHDIGAATLILPYEWWCSEAPISGEEVRRKMRFSFKLVNSAQGRLRAMAPDVVVTSTMVIPWGAVAAWQINRPHAWWIKEFGRPEHGLTFHFSHRATLKTIAEASNMVVVNTPALKRELFPDLPDSKCIVATEANHQLPDPQAHGAEPSPYRFPDSLKLIITGRVTPGKGQDDAVLAVARLVHAGIDAELCILGPADSAFADRLRSMVEQERIQGRVHFVGFRQNVREILDLADISLTCSRYEAFGRVTSEAMALGKAVIGTNTGGTPDLVEEGVTGFLYAPGDIEALAEKIRFFAKHPKRVAEFGKRGRQALERLQAANPDDIAFHDLCQAMKKAANTESAQLKNHILQWQNELLAELETDLEDQSRREQHLRLEMERTAQRMEASKAEAVDWVKGTAAQVERRLANQLEAIEHDLGVVRDQLSGTQEQYHLQLGKEHELNRAFGGSEAQRARLESEVVSLLHFVQVKDQDIRVAASFMEELHRNQDWRLLLLLRSKLDRIAPAGSSRRRLGLFMLSRARAVFRIVRGWRPPVERGTGPLPLREGGAEPLLLATELADSSPPTAPQPALSPPLVRQAACTIASKNYLSQVRVLAASLAESNPGLELYVLLVDRPDNKFDPDEEPYHLISIDDLDNIPNPSHFFFKYDPIELNTAVKPYFLEHLFQKFGLQRLCYFDPDIYVFGDLRGIWELLQFHGVVMTPHITSPYVDDRRPTELDLVRAGVFNLGFLAIARNDRTARLLRWWKSRLYDFGYMQPSQGMHVDQSWMAFAPSFQDDVFVLRDPAYNIAYWNLHERGARLRFAEQRLLIDHRPAAFFHFSGMDIENLNAISRHQNRYTLKDFENLRPLFEFYRDATQVHGNARTRKWSYAFGRFDNGLAIPQAARRLYGSLPADMVVSFGDPFVTGSETSFFHWMNQSAAPADATQWPMITRLHMALHRERPDLQRAFPDPLGADRERFRAWLQERGAAQVGLAPAMMPEGTPPAHDVPPQRAPRTPSRVRLRAGAFSVRSRVANRLRGRINPEGRVATVLRGLDQRIFRLPPAPAALAPTPPEAAIVELPFGVNVTGYIEGEFGVAEGARASLEALASVAIPCALNNIRADIHRHEDSTFQAFVQENPYRANLVHVNADQVPLLMRQKGREYFEGRYNIGYWFWELSRFPEGYRAAFEPFQEIWVASGFVQDSIANTSPVPVVKMPFPALVSESPGLIQRGDMGLPEHQYIFGFSFDYLSVPERKNPLGLIEAFRRAFRSKDPALLLIKSINAVHAPETAAALRQAAEGCNVMFMDQHMSRMEMMAVSRSLDCFVSLHRSEGFGIGLAQAMHMAKPVIGTGYSGNMEFMNASNSFLVRYDLVELAEDHGPYAKGNVWANPDLDHAASLMRHVFENREAAREVALRGQADVRWMLAPRRAGEAMAERLRLVLGLPEVAAPAGSGRTEA